MTRPDLTSDPTRPDPTLRWTVSVAGPASSLYEGEIYRLNFRFSQKYPFDSPEVRHSPRDPLQSGRTPGTESRIRTLTPHTLPARRRQNWGSPGCDCRARAGSRVI